MGLKSALFHLLFSIYLAQMHTAFYYLILCSKLSFPWLISSSVSEILILLFFPLLCSEQRGDFLKKITICRQQQPPRASPCLLDTGLVTPPVGRCYVTSALGLGSTRGSVSPSGLLSSPAEMISFMVPHFLFHSLI